MATRAALREDFNKMRTKRRMASAAVALLAAIGEEAKRSIDVLIADIDPAAHSRIGAATPPCADRYLQMGIISIKKA
jgi:hypothetical protein